MKRLISILTIVVLVFVAGFCYFLTLPQYSLIQINQAFRTHNLILAQEYIDIDALSTQLGDETINLAKEKMKAEIKPTDNSWESLGQNLGNAIVEAMLPAMSSQIKDGFKTSINSIFEANTKESSNSATSKLANFNSFNIKDILPGGRIKLTPNNGDFLLTVPGSSNNVLIFRMKKQNKKWRIVSLENVKDFVAKISAE